MITPVTFVVAIDGSKKLREYISEISQLIESALDTLMVNDDLGLVLITDITKSVFPLIIVRPHNQKTLKQDILQELASAQDATSKGHPSKAFIHALDLLGKRSTQDQWRPAYILLITDGRPEKEDIEQIWNIVSINEETPMLKEHGPIFLDIYVFNHHHPKRDFVKSILTLFPGAAVVRISGRIHIVKSVWHFRDRVRKIRNSVQASDVSASLAKRRAPGRLQIPTIFKK